MCQLLLLAVIDALKNLEVVYSITVADCAVQSVDEKSRSMLRLSGASQIVGETPNGTL